MRLLTEILVALHGIQILLAKLLKMFHKIVVKQFCRYQTFCTGTELFCVFYIYHFAFGSNARYLYMPKI